MNKKPNYWLATNAAYLLLLYFKDVSLPINFDKNIKIFNNIKFMSYSNLCKKRNILLSGFLSIAPSEYGFTLKEGQKYIILYNNTKSNLTNKFTIAHELRHCLLQHEIDDVVAEREANCFARNLICPIHVRKALCLSTVEEYMQVFNISSEMAKASINTLDQDYFYINKDLMSKCLIQNGKNILHMNYSVPNF